MKRYVSLEEISDGRLYNKNDMVKADCHGCNGCSDCCKGMGNSIVLDPYDVWRLSNGLKKDFQTILAEALDLQVVDGVILPNIKMQGEKEKCIFLNEEGRCSVHSFRPGICRLFPLGRYYQDQKMHYILQTDECKATHSKIKVEKWIDTPNICAYEEFVVDWHYMLNEIEEVVHDELMAGDQEKANRINMQLLQLFYFTPYTEKDFYDQYAQRKTMFLSMMGK